MMNSILILGASGLLGTPLTAILKSRGFTVYTVSQSKGTSDFQLDATNKDELDKLVSEIRPDYILNLIAITDVDWCESNIEVAYRTHVLICQYLANYSDKYGTRIVHVSTDHVYDANCSEESKVNPINVYALTKLMGELELMNADATILRTNFFGRSQTSKKKSLTDVMYDAAKSGQSLTLFDDVFFSPLSISSLCDLIVVVIKEWTSGIYNLGSNNGLSKSEFILEFLKWCDVVNPPIEVKSIDSIDFSAKRPKDMRLNCSKFENAFCIRLPNLSDEIKKVAREFSE